MKRNLLALGALLVAVVLSSFTYSKLTTVYFVYGLNSTTSANEKNLSNYSVTQSSQSTDISGSTYIAWFDGQVSDPAGVTGTEFTTAFEAIDGDYNGTDNDRLSDETNEDTDHFEKRAAL